MVGDFFWKGVSFIKCDKVMLDLILFTLVEDNIFGGWTEGNMKGN